MSALIGRDELHLASVGSVGPRLLVGEHISQLAWVGLVVGHLLVGVCLIERGEMLHISVDVVVVVVEHIIRFGMAMDEVHRCGALVPWLSSEEDAAARSEGGEFLTDFAPDGMVDEHGSHGESRPVEAVAVHMEAVVEVVDGGIHEVEVFAAANVPCSAVALQIGENKSFGVHQLREVVTFELVGGVLVHAVRDNHDRESASHVVGREEDDAALLAIHVDGDVFFLESRSRSGGENQKEHTDQVFE